MSLFWREWGNKEGRPLLYFHGFLGSSLDWEPIISNFDDYRCLAMDLPGHGNTPFAESMTFSYLLSVIALECDRLNVFDAVIVGYSMGGRIALQFADRYPKYVGGIILESASPGIESSVERRARQFFDHQLEIRIRESDPIDFLDWWCDLPMFGAIKFHPDYPALTTQRSQYNKEDVISALREFGPTQLPSLWAQLHTLPLWGYITGENDTKYRQIAERLSETASLSVSIMPDLAHNCHFEAPNQFASLIRQMIQTTHGLD